MFRCEVLLAPLGICQKRCGHLGREDIAPSLPVLADRCLQIIAAYAVDRWANVTSAPTTVTSQVNQRSVIGQDMARTEVRDHRGLAPRSRRERCVGLSFTACQMH
jgi:hypothetical protein